jgi:hypothetical protein
VFYEQHKDWITEQEHTDIIKSVVLADKWSFGQTSDDSSYDLNFPMWTQGFFKVKDQQFTQHTPDIIKTITLRFVAQCPADYVLIRSMACANTFGLDGDFHTDWPSPDKSVTGVLYTDRTWERNWGGDTTFVGEDGLYSSEYEPRKLVMFDSSIEHIGKGPQRRCPAMRSIIAMQAVKREFCEKFIAK